MELAGCAVIRSRQWDFSRIVFPLRPSSNNGAAVQAARYFSFSSPRYPFWAVTYCTVISGCTTLGCVRSYVRPISIRDRLGVAGKT